MRKEHHRHFIRRYLYKTSNAPGTDIFSSRGLTVGAGRGEKSTDGSPNINGVPSDIEHW